MNILNLQTFVTVVRVGNLNRAAELLHVTQSTVTARLDALEEILGQRLLLRSRRGAELSRSGSIFLQHAELIMQTWDLGKRRIDIPKGFAGSFSFGCPDGLWERLGSEVARLIMLDHPDLALNVINAEEENLSRLLRGGMIDLSLSIYARNDAHMCQLGVEDLVEVSSVQREMVYWDPLYIYVDLGEEFHRNHAATFPIDETPHLSFTSATKAMGYLLEQGGSAYLPWRQSQPYALDGKLFPVQGVPVFSRHIYANWNANSLALNPWIVELTEKITRLIETLRYTPLSVSGT